MAALDLDYAENRLLKNPSQWRIQLIDSLDNISESLMLNRSSYINNK